MVPPTIGPTLLLEPEDDDEEELGVEEDPGDDAVDDDSVEVTTVSGSVLQCRMVSRIIAKAEGKGSRIYEIVEKDERIATSGR